MSEEEIVPSETTTETNTEPSPQETSTGIDYDKLEDAFLGITPATEEQPVDQPEKPEETTTTTEEEVKPEKYTFKANGKDVELEIKDEAQKIDLIRKGYTFDENMRKHSEEVKTFETERENFTREKERIELQNFALQIGGLKKEPILDEYGDLYEKAVARYGEEEAKKMFANKEIVSDTTDYHFKKNEYEDWLRKGQSVAQNKELATKENEKNIEAFKTKYGLDDKQVIDLITQANDYLNYTVSMGQKPFPDNTFEVFYRGMNFDTLLKSETEKLNADWEKKFKEEREKLITDFSGNKPKPKPKPVQKASPVATDKSWLDEMEDRIVGINN